MEDERLEQMKQDAGNFKINRTKNSKAIKKIYTDEYSRKNATNSSGGNEFHIDGFKDASSIREAIQKAGIKSSSSKEDIEKIVELSKQVYMTNPIYAALINYLSDMFMWRYKVTPHKSWSKSKSKAGRLSDDDYMIIYNKMLEVVDGLNIEVKFPALISKLLVEGSVYFITYPDEENLTLDTILLPKRYCRRIGESQFGTSLVEFDFTYFDSFGFTEEKKKEFLEYFPEWMVKQYKKFRNSKRSAEYRWQLLDPLNSSCVMYNEKEIPTLAYTIGSIINFEKYQDNEIKRSYNKLKYLVSQKMPIYQDNLIFEVDEIEELHKSLRKIIDTPDGTTRLITTWGDIKIDQVAGNDKNENDTLANAYKAILNNAGFNDSMFTQSSVTALEMALAKDKSSIWKFVQCFLNFYKVAINNNFDFKGYEADVDILPISSYTYDDDIKIYRENATLGVGKIDYFIASGIKQRDLLDTLDLEDRLKLSERVTPFQSSYTQTAEDRKDGGDSKEKGDSKEGAGKDEESKKDTGKSEIEPSDKTEEGK